MKSLETQERYIARLRYCQHKVETCSWPKERDRWIQAVEVYLHLISCDKRHRMSGPGEFCDWMKGHKGRPTAKPETVPAEAALPGNSS